MDLHTTLRIARRHFALMVLCVILVTGVAYASAVRQTKEYSASALLLFQDPGYAQIVLGSSASPPATDPTYGAATDLNLVSLEAVAARAAKAVGLTAAQVASKIAVRAEGQSNNVSVVATAHDPRFAASLATTYAQQFILFRRNAARAELSNAQHVVQRQLLTLAASQQNSSLAASLKNRADELQVLAALQTGNAELVQPATVPGSPSSPAPRRTAAIGLFLGLVLAIFVALLRERLDRRVREVEEIEEFFERPILGTIPESAALGRKKREPWHLPAREREAFMLVSTSLRYFDVNRKIETVMITSAASGDGKTTIARNLAAATALTGGKVLLIEADLRHPVLASVLGLSPGPGLSEVLAGHLTYWEAVTPVPLALGDGPLGDVDFDLLPAGGLPPNPTDLIGSERMRGLLAEVTRNYSLVIIDTPPTAIVSDAIPLLSRVDGVIVVARLNKSTRDSIRHLHSQLDRLGAPVLGVVVNGVTKQTGYYGSRYDYHYAGPAANGKAKSAERADSATPAESPAIHE